MRKSLLMIAVLGAISAPAAVFAAEEAAAATPDWTFPASFSFVSDYIFRGQSQTWGRPAAQFSIEADHKSGFYAGFFSSNVSDKWLPGANLEVDLYTGFRNKFGETDFGYDLGAIAYLYPGADWDESAFGSKSNKLNTGEVYGGLSYKWLSFKTGINVTEYYGWNFNNSGSFNGGFNGDPAAGVKQGGNTRGSYYYELNAAYEVVPTWTVAGQLGRQEIDDARKLDITYYKAGVTKAFDGGWSLGAFYSGTNEPDAYKDFLSLHDGVSKSDIAKDKVFVSITKSF